MARAKTSIEILEERDALRARVEELEAVVEKIDREVEIVLRSPEIHFLSLCRIGALARGAVSPGDGRPDLAKCEPPASGVVVRDVAR